jgi:putative addiction module killer protein
MEGRERKVLYYTTVLGALPFKEWRASITDDNTLAVVDARIARLRGGNLGDSRPIGGGASESKIDFGPGYRIYYGIDGSKVVLLCTGDKSTQDADIRRAKGYWKDYKKRENERRAAERKKEALKNVGLQKRPPGRS